MSTAPFVISDHPHVMAELLRRIRARENTERVARMLGMSTKRFRKRSTHVARFRGGETVEKQPATAMNFKVTIETENGSQFVGVYEGEDNLCAGLSLFALLIKSRGWERGLKELILALLAKGVR